MGSALRAPAERSPVEYAPRLGRPRTTGARPRRSGARSFVASSGSGAAYLVDCIAMPWANCRRIRISTTSGGSMIRKVPAMTMFHSAAARSVV